MPVRSRLSFVSFCAVLVAASAAYAAPHVVSIQPARQRVDVPAEAQMRVLFEEHAAEWLHLRHAEAGCFIARVDRAAA